MKKDIEWLKKEIATEMIELEPNRKEKLSDIKYQTLRSVAQKIYQLYELEVLSKEWIDDNVIHVRGLGDIFEAVAVESLLVPKQELPVIPQWVADGIESKKRAGKRLNLAMSEFPESKLMKELGIDEHECNELYARAWLDGYTVKEEQKYYVSERDEEYGGFWFLSKNNNGDISIGVNRDWSEVNWDRLKLTEQEIKDYDSRYWPFRQPVEELEG